MVVGACCSIINAQLHCDSPGVHFNHRTQQISQAAACARPLSPMRADRTKQTCAAAAVPTARLPTLFRPLARLSQPLSHPAHPAIPRSLPLLSTRPSLAPPMHPPLAPASCSGAARRPVFTMAEVATHNKPFSNL